MERLGKLIAKSAFWLALFMLFILAPLMGRSHANEQQRAAHQKWGSALTGKVVKFTSPVFGESTLPVRTADIKFTGHNGEPVTVNRVIYYTNKVGEPFTLWQADDGSVFVKYDQGKTGSFSLKHLSPLSYRTGPWPTTQGTYFWRFVFIGGGGALGALLIYHIGCSIEERAHKKRRNQLTVVNAA